MHFTLDVPGFQADKSKRIWTLRTVRPLKNKTLLIVGLGHTGRAVAARAKAFGMEVIGTRARPVAMENVDEVGRADDLSRMLPRADFIAISTPLTAQTQGLIGQQEINLMKQGVVLADVSRGGVVDQTALLEGLQNQRIAGAALDVFEIEPLPAESPMWDAPNTIISPHCSSVHDAWQEASFDLFLTNLHRWTRKEILLNTVDPTRGY